MSNHRGNSSARYYKEINLAGSLGMKQILEQDSDATETCNRNEKSVEALEKQLRSCSEEMAYLQNQLSLRNVEANFMGEHVHSLELKLLDVGRLQERLGLLSKELNQSKSQCLTLMRLLKGKEEELENSAFNLEKLEKNILSMTLDYQCEIESMKLEITSLEQRCIEAENFSDQAAQEQAQLTALLEEVEIKFQEAQREISRLEKENNELKDEVIEPERCAKRFFSTLTEQFDDRLKQANRGNLFELVKLDQASLARLRRQLPWSEVAGTCEEVMGAFLSELAVISVRNESTRDDVEETAKQIHEYEVLVKQLKEELREEKLKAKEEADDLIQEMAELRYQVMGMLEEECKRRACIEQASIQRIQELEARVREEQEKYEAAVRHYQEVCDANDRQLFQASQLGSSEARSSSITSCCCGNPKTTKNPSYIEGEVIVDHESASASNASQRALIQLHPFAVTTHEPNELRKSGDIDAG